MPQPAACSVSEYRMKKSCTRCLNLAFAEDAKMAIGDIIVRCCVSYFAEAFVATFLGEWCWCICHLVRDDDRAGGFVTIAWTTSDGRTSHISIRWLGGNMQDRRDSQQYAARAARQPHAAHRATGTAARVACCACTQRDTVQYSTVLSVAPAKPIRSRRPPCRHTCTNEYRRAPAYALIAVAALTL